MPYKQNAAKSIAIIVPFRDREAHFDNFRDKIEAMIQAWKAKGIHHKWAVFVVEQFDDVLFNRGYTIKL